MTASGWRKLAVGLAAIGWGGVVLAFYSIVHKPVSPSQLPALGSLAATLVGWGGTLVLAHWLGRICVPFLPVLRPREKFAVQIGLGLGVLGLGMLALGAVGGYWAALAWIITLGALLLLGPRAFLADLTAVVPRWPTTRTDRALALFVSLALAVALLNALAPPTAWDSLVYHLTGPKLYLQTHRLHHDIDLPYLGFPHWGSMLFTWGMMLAGPQLAQILHFTFTLLTLAVLPAIVNRIAPGRAWLAAGVLMAVPTALYLAGWAYVEWLTMFTGVGALVCLRHSDSARRREGPVLIAGLLSGLALGAKYTTAGLVLGLGTVAAFQLKSIRLMVFFAFGAALGGGPYLLKNLILTGNPVYPFFLPGKFWDSFRADWYSRAGTGLSLWQVVFAPWDATVWGVEGLAFEGQVNYAATLGPLLLILIPFVWVGWRSRAAESRRWLRAVIGVCGIAYAVWAVQLTFSGLLAQSRLLFPILPLLAVLAVTGFDGLATLNTSQLRAQFVVGVLVGIGLLFTLVDYALLLFSTSPVPVVLGLQSRNDFLSARLGAYALAVNRINELPTGSEVVFLWEPRSFYCGAEVRCEPDALLDRWWHLRQLGLSAQQVADRWRIEGVTHILIFETGRAGIEQARFDPLTAEDWAQLRSLRADQLILIEDFFGAYQLYAIQ